MDGVLWKGTTPLPGLHEFFATLRATGRRFVLATNNATRTPDQYVSRFTDYGIEISDIEILTSAIATAHLIARENNSNLRVYPIGEHGLLAALAAENIEAADEDVDAVVVGLDRQLNWDKLTSAALHINAGARFIGTNPDTSFPTERGVVPGNGAILAALEVATGVTPRIIGKPEPELYNQALKMMQAVTADTLVIGDRLDTDIAGALRAGLDSLLVLTGISTGHMLESSSTQPTYVLPGLPEVTIALKN